MLESQRPRQHEHATALAAVVHRASGEKSLATISRLWFDGCELASDEQFALSENIEIEIAGMGKIRGRDANDSKLGILVRFLEECPV